MPGRGLVTGLGELPFLEKRKKTAAARRSHDLVVEAFIYVKTRAL